MLPAMPFLYMLIGLGFLTMLRGVGNTRTLILATRIYGIASLSVVLAITVILAAYYIHTWPEAARRSDEGLLREMRPILASSGREFLLVSAVTRGFTELEAVEFVDLVSFSVSHGDRDLAVQNVVQATSTALEHGHDVFYLYTQFEAGHDFQGDGRDRYDLYFLGVSESFAVTEVYRTETHHSGRDPWLLFKVEPKDTPAR
jgi:hypothetical protein